MPEFDVGNGVEDDLKIEKYIPLVNSNG